MSFHPVNDSTGPLRNAHFRVLGCRRKKKRQKVKVKRKYDLPPGPKVHRLAVKCLFSHCLIRCMALGITFTRPQDWVQKWAKGRRQSHRLLTRADSMSINPALVSTADALSRISMFSNFLERNSLISTYCYVASSLFHQTKSISVRLSFPLIFIEPSSLC